MSDYYCFATEAEARTCISYINSTPWFPIVGKNNGVDALDKQATTKWCEDPMELVAGGWAVPRIPESRLDYVVVPQADRDAFMLAFGADIRSLESSDFVVIPVNEDEL